MTSPEGGFYSAEDADSEGEEGVFYVWNPEELRQILTEDEAELFITTYNIKKGGNFKDQSTGKKTGDSIPHLTKSIAEIAKDEKWDEQDLHARLESIRNKLFSIREKRIHPFKDDKILTDWNGLMIAALAKGANAFNDQSYALAAKKAADFVLLKLRNKDGRLLKRYRQGKAGLPAHIEDYAFFVWGLIDLYEASFEEKYLLSAIELHTLLIRHFEDADKGGLFMTADDGEKLLVRSKEIYDGAIPSGNSVATLNALRLGRMIADQELEQKAQKTFQAFSGPISQYPVGHSQLLIALDFAVGPSFEIVICGQKDSETTKKMLLSINKNFIPNKVVLFKGAESSIAEIAKFTKAMSPIDNDSTTAFVCKNFACNLPTNKIDTVLKSLGVTEK